MGVNEPSAEGEIFEIRQKRLYIRENDFKSQEKYFMTITDIRNEIIAWRFSMYKVLNFAIGMSALLLYEFVGRPYYRPYIYSNNIYDFHIADTLGNSLGTIAAVFIFISLLSHDHIHGYFLLKITTASIVLYEMAQPLLGKRIDPLDIVATIVTGGICFLVYSLLFKDSVAARAGR